MTAFSLKKTIAWDGVITEKVTSICRMFGLTIDRLREQKKVHSCKLDIKDGDIVYITGPSGSGKSVLLNELENSIDPQRVQQKIELLDAKEKKFIEREFRIFLKSFGGKRYNVPSLERTRFVLTRLTERPVYYIWFNKMPKVKSA